MSHSLGRAAIAGLLVLGVAACGVVSSVRPHGSTSMGPAPRMGAPAPTDARPPADTAPGVPTIGALPGTARGTRSPDERVVCRTSGPPRGWISVAYVSAAGQCPVRAGADSAAAEINAAVVTRYAGRPIAAVLDVCADQATPMGWETVTGASTEDAGRCPGASRGGGSSTKRIRRIQ